MAALTGSGKGIQIVVGANYKDADLKRAQRDLDALKAKAAATATPMQKLGSTITAQLGPALAMAGAAAAAFAVSLAVDSVKAAIADQQAAEKLTQTLTNLGLAHDNARIEDFIFKLQMATGVVDDNLRPAYERLVRSTQNTDEAMRALQIAVDISAGKGKDLGLVANALGKAYDGNTNALGRLGLGLDSTLLKSNDVNAVMSELSRLFSGQAATAASTWAGKIQRVSVAFDELKESFGTGFLSSLNNVGSSADNLVQTLVEARPAAENLGKALGDIGNTLSGSGESFNVIGYAINQNLGQATAIVQAVEFSWKSLIAAVTGSWPEDETQRATKSVQAMAYEIEHSGKGAGIMAEMFGSQAAPATMQLGDAASYSSDAISLLREDIRLATRSLGPLAAAFDEANAAMERRQSMQNYRDALKSYIEEPSKDTMAAVESAMIDAAGSFTDPKKQAQFTKQAIDDITTAATNAGQKVPSEFDAINSAAAIALDPVSKLKQALLDIPSDIPVTITVTEVTPGGRIIATGGPVFATGGPVRASLGTHASDDVPAMLSRGEYVLNADTVKRLGVGTLNRLNNGGAAGGGMVIQQLNVTAAAGERAEESVPRALRRMAFVAGLNG